MKTIWKLEGLDCADCANRIEAQIGELPQVKEANINFVTKKLTVIFDGEVELDIKKIVKKIEPSIRLEIVDAKNIQQKQFYVDHLDCANCALKIEEHVKKMDGVKDATLNFASGKLLVKMQGDSSDITSQIKQTVPTLESGITIEEITTDKQVSHHFDWKQEWTLWLGILLFVIGLIIQENPFGFWIFLASYILCGYSVVLQAVRNILRGEIFDENFLMSIATIGAFFIQEYPEAVAVMIFYQVGELFQSIAVNRSRQSISSLMDIKVDTAIKIIGDQEEEVPSELLKINDLILVKAGERVPVDGVVVKGDSDLDTSALTGESLPRAIHPTEVIMAGVVNLSGVLEIQVTHTMEDSTVSRILDLVENASSKKAPMEKFITRFARIYTPIVVLSAIAIAIFPMILIPGAVFHDWLYRALTFLVISCPCAFVISIPLGLFAGIGAASKKGVLIKGGNYLEALNDISTIVFDKTGTLTEGKFYVEKVMPNGITENELLELATYGEYYSNHPIATSIKEAYKHEVDKNRISEYHELAGNGIEVKIDGIQYYVGNQKMMEMREIDFEVAKQIGTTIYVARGTTYLGTIIIRDRIKQNSKTAIQTLKQHHIATVMLTGDQKNVGESVAQELGIDEVYTQLLPQDKVTKLERLLDQQGQGKKLAFVGDGINDAPVLARSDIGIAMGGIGSDAAIEAADIVLMRDDISSIVDAIKVAQATKRILWQDVIFSFTIKIIILALSLFGLANMWMGVFADVGVTLIVIINSMRLLKKPKVF